MLFDLHQFRRVRERHGHLAGDHALVAVADLLGDGIHTDGGLARHGGEPFADEDAE